MRAGQVLAALAAALFMQGAAPASAQGTALTTLRTGEDTRGFEGVGRLDIRGKGFCTAALIREDRILTAAHCVYNDQGELIAPGNFTFLASLRDNRAEATRGVARLAAHPAYVPNAGELPFGTALDIAVLELDQPIRNSRIRPFAISSRPLPGDSVGVVSYGQGREDHPSLQEVCSVLGRSLGSIVMDCDVIHGSSGAPVFSMEGDGAPQIVSVISALGHNEDEKVSIGTSLETPLREVIAALDATPRVIQGGVQRILTVGEQNQTGAKFVRP